MENIKEQFARLYAKLDLTDDQTAMIKKLQMDVDAALRQPPVIKSVCENCDTEVEPIILGEICPFCKCDM